MYQRLIFSLLLLASSFNGLAQYGAISVYVPANYERIEGTILMSVWKSDTLTAQKIIKLEDETIIDSLKPGVYKVELYINNDLQKTYHRVEIKAGQYTNISMCSFDTFFSSMSERDDTELFEVSIPVMLGFSMPTNAVRYPLGTSFSLGFREVFYTGGKHLQWAATTGLDFGYTRLFNDTNFTWPILPKKRERYFNVSFPIGMLFRFTAYNALGKKNGFKIDVGALYSVPLYYRHIWIDYNNSKIVNRYIHKYNEIYVVGRIGVGAFGIHAEYCITDFLKRPYRQPPKLKLGISVNLQPDR